MDGEPQEYLFSSDDRSLQAAVEAAGQLRKHGCLLREDVLAVCCADVQVWPSIDAERGTVESQRYEPDAMPVQAASGFLVWRIALALVLTKDDLLARRNRWPYVDAATASTLVQDPSWERLGYDVIADESLLSGLSNCAYRQEEREALRGFAEDINEYHLFRSLSLAEAFARVANARAPEHAPFLVCSIRRQVQLPAGRR